MTPHGEDTFRLDEAGEGGYRLRILLRMERPIC